MKPLVAANWKLNLPSSIEIWCAGVEKPSDTDISVFVPATHISEVALGVRLGTQIGAQDVSRHQSGAYTGDIAASMVATQGATQCLIGHSERRTYAGDNEEILADKASAAIASGLSLIWCIGETLEERRDGRANARVAEQLHTIAANCSGETLAAIAYEPVWAIGTGETASPDEIEQMHGFIAEQAHASGLSQPRILYGGSVNRDNAPLIASLSSVDGVLVGGASLEASSFSEIVQAFV